MLSGAREEMAALPLKIRQRIDKRILTLAREPRPSGCKALKGDWRGHLRVRSGDYRIIYRVVDDRLIVVVVKIGNRKDVYD